MCGNYHPFEYVDCLPKSKRSINEMTAREAADQIAAILDSRLSPIGNGWKATLTGFDVEWAIRDHWGRLAALAHHVHDKIEDERRLAKVRSELMDAEYGPASVPGGFKTRSARR